MGKSYCPGWSQTVAEGNFCAKTPAYLCGNQPVSQVIRVSLSRRRGPLRGPNSATTSERVTPHPDHDTPQIEARLKFDTVDNNLEHLLQELVRVHVLPDVPFELPPEGVELIKGNLTRLIII